MTYDQMSDKLAGPIGLLKQFVISTFSVQVKFNQLFCRFASRTARETAEGWSPDYMFQQC